ncbi:MAG: hypothetical protein KF857_02015 [Fimbriimonadaceae bacterium]|nr:hypothetical protein [Fimbriimonadaceae bacterium]
MSDDQTPPPVKKPMATWLRQIVLTGICLLIILLVFWSSMLRMESVRRKELSRGVDALSPLLASSLLERKPDKLRQTLQALAASGRYERVTVTDAQGAVIASTDRTVEGTARPDLVKAPTPAMTDLKQGRYIITRAVNLGESNMIGAVEVVVVP